MKRRIVSLILALVLALGLSTTASAYTNQQFRAAEALYHLGLFRGTSTEGKEFALDRVLQRAEGTILLVRMLGKASEAKTADRTGLPFDDVTFTWDEGCIAYAYHNKIVNGMKTDDYIFFGPFVTMEEYMFLTLTLRALGYSDSGDEADFSWRDPYALAVQAGLIGSTTPDEEFTRGDAVLIFWNAMSAKLKGSNVTLSDSLIDAGVFTDAEYAEAKEIWSYGYVLPDTPGAQPTPSSPSDPDTDTDAGSPTAPDSGSSTEPDDGEMTYEKYIALSGAEQQAFMETFESIPAFFEWYNAAKAEYEANRESIEIGGDGIVDLGKIVDGGN